MWRCIIAYASLSLYTSRNPVISSIVGSISASIMARINGNSPINKKRKRKDTHHIHGTKKFIMLNLIVGLGVQGNKRIKYLNNNYVTVDPLVKSADFKNISEVPLNKITHAYICTPENQKFKIIKNLLKKNINILVEKTFDFKKRGSRDFKNTKK